MGPPVPSSHHGPRLASTSAGHSSLNHLGLVLLAGRRPPSAVSVVWLSLPVVFAALSLFFGIWSTFGAVAQTPPPDKQGMLLGGLGLALYGPMACGIVVALGAFALALPAAIGGMIRGPRRLWASLGVLGLGGLGAAVAVVGSSLSWAYVEAALRGLIFLGLAVLGSLACLGRDDEGRAAVAGAHATAVALLAVSVVELAVHAWALNGLTMAAAAYPADASDMIGFYPIMRAGSHGSTALVVPLFFGVALVGCLRVTHSTAARFGAWIGLVLAALLGLVALGVPAIHLVGWLLSL